MATNHTSLICSVIILISFLSWQIYRRRKIAAGNERNEYISSIRGNEPVDFPATKGWWLHLPDKEQCRLAFDAAQWCLPIWKKYPGYDGSSGSPDEETPLIGYHQLLVIIAQLTSSAKPERLSMDEAAIRTCYIQLLVPMVALQDGTWRIPYPLKKSFLSVFTLAEAMLTMCEAPDEQVNFYQSIRHSIDCLELANLYTQPGIESLLEPYRILSENSNAHLPLNTTATPSR